MPSTEIRVRCPDLLLERVDLAAERLGLSRAAVLRLCAELQVDHLPGGAPRRSPSGPTPGHGSQP